MTTFTDGPAKGVQLNCLRTPVYLRVVRDQKGKFDALDQLRDEPKPREVLYAYVMDGDPVRGFFDGTYCGPFHVAKYRIVVPQPDQACMRMHETWCEWVGHHAAAAKGGL